MLRLCFCTLMIFGYSQKWRAANLVWDPYEYGGIEEIPVPAKLIWTPDILLYNR